MQLFARLLALVFIALFLLAHLRLGVSYLEDDAYITYRYAANLAQGDGLVYNAGERVLGTTTPGYAALLGLAGAIFGTDAIPAASRTLNALCLLFAGICGYLTATRLTQRPIIGAITLGLVLLSYDTLYGSLAGMESPLFLALTGLSLLALVHDRRVLAGFAAGLLVWVRPEGAFVIGLYVLHFAAQYQSLSRAELAKIAAALLLPGLVWAVIATLYYGSPIPQSVVAKRAGLYPLEVYDSTAGVIAYLGHSFGIRSLTDDSLGLFALVAGLSTLVLAFGGLWIWRSQRRLWFVPLFVFIMLAFYATSQTQLFTYYFAFFGPLQSVCWWAGLYLLARTLAGWRVRPRLNRALVGITAALTLLPSLLAYPVASIAAGEALVQDFGLPILRLREYERIAHEVDVPPDSVVLMPEIGVLGFYMDDVYVLDSAGLVSPEAVAYFPVPADQRPELGAGVIPPQMVRDYQPDMLISLEIFGRFGIFDDAWLWDNYQTTIERQGDWLPWGARALWVLQRTDSNPQ